ncbi:MAG: CHAT domain-containing protein [Gloeocapsa sp. DLM2.Bin57]|nr:MAG: CHAT domain-containing protein [Gloeocapsa sp. DLM2.Bin57]
MNPNLTIVISRLNSSDNVIFAVWVIDSPLPEGFTHHHLAWSPELTTIWLAWQEMFSPGQRYNITGVENTPFEELNLLPNHKTPYSTRLMQQFGVNLWEWLWSGDIRRSLEQNQSFALGLQASLRIRLDIRDPDLIPIPWEIMLPSTSRPAISVNQQILFSRISSDVGILRLKDKIPEKLKILLVLGEKETFSLQEDEAEILKNIFQAASSTAEIDILLQPSTKKLIRTLDNGDYNLFFYGGHGEKTPEGGLLYLRSDTTINGIELAQVLVRNQVTLTVFNACWSAQPDQEEGVMIERSSLAEVLLHYGIPAVLGMRDTITNEEALTFIEAFSGAIAIGKTIDEGVRIARQQLLTIYKFNQPTWTLPILYLHPQFDGVILKPPVETTILPSAPLAYLCLLEGERTTWKIQGLIRIGRHPVGRSGETNDVVITEPWISSEHALIIHRENDDGSHYVLKDISRYGTYVNISGEWELFHHQDIPLQHGTKIRFGAINGQILEFRLENPNIY